jgi:hypothetical protein
MTLKPKLKLKLNHPALPFLTTCSAPQWQAREDARLGEDNAWFGEEGLARTPSEAFITANAML